MRSNFERQDLKQLYPLKSNANPRSIEERYVVLIDRWTSHCIQYYSLSGRFYTLHDQQLTSVVVKRTVLVLGSRKLRREHQISKHNHRLGDEDEYQHILINANFCVRISGVTV